MTNKKTAVIVLIVIAAVIIIYFLGSKVVGKAITLPVGVFDSGKGGAEALISLPAEADDLVTLRIGANLDSKESVGFSFTLSYDSTILELVDVDTKLPEWGSDPDRDFIRTSTPRDLGGNRNEVTFEHATIDFTKRITGAVRLAEANFVVKPTKQLTIADFERATPATNAIVIQSLSVLDLNTVNDATVGNEEIITGRPLRQVGGIAACTACPSVAATGYTTDINGDRTINGQDAFIILKIAEARVRTGCGGPTETPCGPFSGTYTCENGDFRVQGYKGFTDITTGAGGTTCATFADTAAYLATSPAGGGGP